MLNPCAEVAMADARVGFRDHKHVEAEDVRVRVEAVSAKVREKVYRTRVREEAESAICDNLLQSLFSYLVKRCGYTNRTT